MSTELETALARELQGVADALRVPPMPSLPAPDAQGPLRSRLWQPLLVAASIALLVGALAVALSQPSKRPTPASPQEVTIPVTAPTVPFVVDQRLYVDGTQVPGTWWSVESRGETWLALRSDGSWWSGTPGRDTGRIDAQMDQPPVLSPDGSFIALVDLTSGRAILTGFDTQPSGEGFGAAPIDLPSIEGGVPIRVRAVTDDGDVIVQGRRTSLMWRAQLEDQQTVVDLSESAPDQQVLAATTAGLVVVEGPDSDPQSVQAYLADISAGGRLTPKETLPTYDDLEISPGGTWLLRSPAGTLGGEVTATSTLNAQEIGAVDEVTLDAPAGWGFATNTWMWEDDQTFIAVLLPQGDAAKATRLARCSVTLGACRAFAAPAAPAAEPDPSATSGTSAGLSAEATLGEVIAAVVAGDRDRLVDQAVIGDGEWDQLVSFAAGGDGSGSGCRDNGSGTQDCEIILLADPTTTYYAILTPASNTYGWRITYVSIASD